MTKPGMIMRTHVVLATALSIASAVGCGSDTAPCGGDFCEPTLTLKWSFNEDAMPGFPGAA